MNKTKGCLIANFATVPDAPPPASLNNGNVPLGYQTDQ
uniref:Uncharacterized protein n=1 Tax=Enterobacter cloacae TaxID=550 RepID=A0A2L1KQM1_ENTCL|nr:hypothetical protein [Enterobacter cloacae]